ncbi:expressed unknown protein [Seminavis robusta]|uniref:Uncharacterized protein n=1 Tax=Seminavis robusta TaxID=568900 RepID=A0A9N8DGB7_9STRA|nr:expressed unknown protein [Seminavis robusta]|eukprot:Sro77_g041970.1 n/a (228) ;mRNA; r:45949-46791
MDDKKSPLYIDPFRYPSDDDIDKKLKLWEKEEGEACQSSAVKWLNCIRFVKQYYRLEGRDLKDGMQWQQYMLRKCYVPYTDYKGCVLDERHAEMERLKAQYGPEKWENSQDLVKATLAEKYGTDVAHQLVNYSQDYRERFYAMRKIVDEEMGVIRNGMAAPDIPTSKPDLPIMQETKPAAPTIALPKPTTTADNQQKSSSSSFGFKGWWSQPESRFKKPSNDTGTSE